MLFISAQMTRDKRRIGNVIHLIQPIDAIEQCMHDISNILVAGGSTFHKVVKVTVFVVTDVPSQYREIFEIIYQAYFEGKPARTMVEVAKLEGDAKMAIECIALV